MLRALALLFALLAPGSVVQAGTASANPALAPSGAPHRTWEVGLETAQMIGLRNPNHYYFSTQMLSLAFEPLRPLRMGTGQLRSQLLSTFIWTAIFGGSESYYLGWGPQLRFILSPSADSRWSFYFGGGAGLGVADADEANKTDRGLGQDFTFIILAGAGVRYSINDRWSVSLGGLWHHLSNADLSEPDKRNTGLDALGPVLGASYRF